MTRRKLLPLAVLFGVALMAFESRAATYQVAEGSKVEFTAKITGSSFVATSEKLSGSIELDADTGKLAAGAVAVAADAFETGLGLRDNHMRDKYLEAKKYPAIVFQLKPGEVKVVAGQTSTVQGTFKIKKGSKDITIAAKTVSVDGNRIVISSSFPLVITDYGIPQPGFAIVKMETTIKVKLDLVLTAKAP